MSSSSFSNDNILTVDEATALLLRQGVRAVAEQNSALRVHGVERVDRLLVGQGADIVEVLLGLYSDTDKAITSSSKFVSTVREMYPGRTLQRFNYGRTVVLAVGDAARAEAVLQILREQSA